MDASISILKKATKEAQGKLASYVRNGNLVEIEGARTERLHHYRRLVFNVIFDTLSSAYPISRKLLSSSWKDLVDRYFSTHNCQNYQVWRMPQEFYLYVKKEEQELNDQFPFLADLLYFEWIEIELYSEENIETEPYDNNGNWHTDEIIINPHHKILELEYPVFTDEYSNMKDKKGRYYLAVFRDLKELKIRFVQLSPLFVKAIISMKLKGVFSDALQESSSSFGTFSKEEIQAKSAKTVDLLFDRGLILGYKKN